MQSNYKIRCVSGMCCPGTMNVNIVGPVDSSGMILVSSDSTLNVNVASPLGTDGGVLISSDSSLTIITASGSTSSISIQNTDQVIGTVLLGNNGMIDAFSRLRSSNPVTLFECSMEVDEQPLLWDLDVTGSATFNYNVNQSSVSLNVVGSSSSIVRQSHQYTRYQPGKSLMNLCSFTLGARSTGVTRRVGLFDSENGVYLEQTDSDIYFVVRTFVSGGAVETKVPQTSWNIDPIDGTGPSGFTLDETNTNLTVIDLEWLGVGRVRVGFFIEGRIIYAHQFNFVIPTVYMTRASLPVRYEISSNGIASGTSSLTQICSTVLSEGGFEPKGMIRAADLGNTTRSVGSASYLPLLAIRLKSAYNKAFLSPIDIQVLTSGGGIANYRLLSRAQVLDGSWVSASEAVELNTTGSTFSGGYQITGGYVSNQTRVILDTLQSSTLTNSSDIAGTSDEIVLIASSLSGSINMAGAIQWREIF